MNDTEWGEWDDVTHERDQAQRDLRKGIISGYLLDWARGLGDVSVLDGLDAERAVA